MDKQVQGIRDHLPKPAENIVGSGLQRYHDEVPAVKAISGLFRGALSPDTAGFSESVIVLVFRHPLQEAAPAAVLQPAASERPDRRLPTGRHLRRFRLFGQLPGRNKLKGPVAGCWFHLSPKSNSSCLVAGCCEACGQPPTCGQGGGNAWRFPRLVHRGPRWRGQAGIGAADCPQIHSTSSASRQAASAVAAVDWPR